MKTPRLIPLDMTRTDPDYNRGGRKHLDLRSDGTLYMIKRTVSDTQVSYLLGPCSLPWHGHLFHTRLGAVQLNHVQQVWELVEADEEEEQEFVPVLQR